MTYTIVLNICELVGGKEKWSKIRFDAPTYKSVYNLAMSKVQDTVHRDLVKRSLSKDLKIWELYV